MIPPHTRQRSFDQRLVLLTQAVRRELRGLDALSFEDSGVIEAALAEVRRANADTVKALFPLIAHVNYVDNCLTRRLNMWDATRAVRLWLGGVKSFGRLISGKRDGFYEAIESATSSFELALETTELAFKCGEKMAVATGRLCNKNVLVLQGEISNIGRELQDVTRLCAEEEENVKLKSKYLEDRLQAELRGREDLEDEISEGPDRYGGVLKATMGAAKTVIFGLAFTYTITIPGFFSFGCFASISIVTYLAPWTKIFSRGKKKDTGSIQNKIAYSEKKTDELERQLKAIKRKASELRKVAEAYEEAQRLFNLLPPNAKSMQLMTSQFETLLSNRKAIAESRLAKIRDIRPPNSSLWYRPIRADVVDLSEEILTQFKRDYEEGTFTAEEEVIIMDMEEKLGHLRSRTKTLKQIHTRIRIESEGIEDSNEMQKGSPEHLRLSAIILLGIIIVISYAWSHRQCFLQGAKFVTRQASWTILWTLKRMIIKLWQATVNMLLSLKTPFRLLCALAPNVTYFALNVSLYLSSWFLGYALLLPVRFLLLVGLVLLRVFTARLIVIGVMGWFLVYHGPAWDEIWAVVYDWAVWGILAGWRWLWELWEFSGSEGARQALVLAS